MKRVTKQSEESQNSRRNGLNQLIPQLQQSLTAHSFNNNPRMLAQRKLSDMIRNSPRQAAQRRLSARIRNSPSMSAQYNPAAEKSSEQPLSPATGVVQAKRYTVHAIYH